VKEYKKTQYLRQFVTPLNNKVDINAANLLQEISTLIESTKKRVAYNLNSSLVIFVLENRANDSS
jgi:hypothetical protein